MKYIKEDSIYMDTDLRHLVKDTELLINSKVSGYDIEEGSGVDYTLVYKYRKDPNYLDNIQLGTLFKIANYPNKTSVTSDRVFAKLFKVANSDAMNNKSKFANYLNIARSQLNHLTDRDSMISMNLQTANKLLNYLNSSFEKILSNQYRPRVAAFISSRNNGVGRTSLSLNLGSYFDLEGYRTLIVGYHTRLGLDVFLNDDTELPENMDITILDNKSDNSLQNLISSKKVKEDYDYIIIDTNDDIDAPLKVADKVYIVEIPGDATYTDLTNIEKVKDRVHDGNILNNFDNIVNKFSLVGNRYRRTDESKKALKDNSYLSMFSMESAIDKAYAHNNTSVFKYSYENNDRKSAVDKKILLPMRNLVQDINSSEIFNLNEINNKLNDGNKIKSVLELGNNINKYEVIGDLYDQYLRLKKVNSVESLNKRELCLAIVSNSNLLESTYDFIIPKYIYIALNEIIRLSNLNPRKNNLKKYNSINELRSLLDSSNKIITLNFNSLITIIVLGLFKPDIELQKHLLSTIEGAIPSYGPLIISGHIIPAISGINESIQVNFIDDLSNYINIERISLMDKYLKQKKIKNDQKLISNINLISKQFKSFSEMIFDDQAIVKLKLHVTLFEDVLSPFE